MRKGFVPMEWKEDSGAMLAKHFQIKNVNVIIYTLEDLKPRLRGSVFKGNVTDK